MLLESRHVVETFAFRHMLFIILGDYVFLAFRTDFGFASTIVFMVCQILQVKLHVAELAVDFGGNFLFWMTINLRFFLFFYSNNSFYFNSNGQSWWVGSTDLSKNWPHLVHLIQFLSQYISCKNNLEDSIRLLQFEHFSIYSIWIKYRI